MPLSQRTIAERLQARLLGMPNGCIEWTGCLDTGGYGQISVNNRMVLVHRLAWELANGPIPDGLSVLHHCDNPPCCETEPTEGYPEGHLFLGTHAENNADRSAKGRGHNQKKTHCIHGHPFDETNTYIAPSTGKRMCLTCMRATGVRSNAKRRAKRRAR